VRNKYEVAADLGLLCTPNDLKQVYGSWLYHPNYIGIQSMAWKVWGQMFVNLANRDGMRVTSLHGPTGLPDHMPPFPQGVQGQLINSFMLNPEQTVNLTTRNHIETLVIHVNALRHHLESYSRFPGRLLVEGDWESENGWQAALFLAAQVQKIQPKEATVGVVVDRGHIRMEQKLTENEIIDVPNQIMDHLIYRSHTPSISKVMHEPIGCGSDNWDVLATSNDNIARWQQYYENRPGLPITFENKPPTSSFLKLSKRKIRSYAIRTSRVLNRLLGLSSSG
jgi:hypothetical protein